MTIYHKDLVETNTHVVGHISASEPVENRAGVAWFNTQTGVLSLRNINDSPKWIACGKGTDVSALQTALTALQGTVTGHVGTAGFAHPAATINAPGFMSAADKTKLDQVQLTHTHTNATTGVAGFMSAADKTKLDAYLTSIIIV